MPTATSAGGFDFQNAGPLTTTWTAPSSCSTIAPTILSGVGHPQIPGLFEFAALGPCESHNSTQGCVPNSDNVDALYPEPFPAFPYRYYYYSPGLHCPNAWETVGVVAMNNGSASVTGIFSSTDFQYYTDEKTSFPRENFAANALTSVLASTETAIACCPSGFSAHPLYGCHSSFPATELAGRTGCIVQFHNLGYEAVTETFEYHGVTTTNTGGQVVTPSLGSVETLTSTYTLGPSGLPADTDLYQPSATDEPRTGMAYTNLIYLINSGEEGESNDQAKDETEGDDKGGKESASSVLTASRWAVVGTIVAVWAAGIAAGGPLATF